MINCDAHESLVREKIVMAKRLGALGIMLLGLFAGCWQSALLHPSYTELEEAGFYVYVLPEDVVMEHGWVQEISIWSFDRHCKGLTAVEQSNPLEVFYQSPSDEKEELQNRSAFSVRLGPWSPPWGRAGSWSDVELMFDGNPVTAQYKLGDSSVDNVFAGVRFTDTLGSPIYVSSWLPFTETVSLIDQLQYVGPSLDTFVDPWNCTRYFEK